MGFTPTPPTNVVCSFERGWSFAYQTFETILNITTGTMWFTKIKTLNILETNSSDTCSFVTLSQFGNCFLTRFDFGN